MGTLDYRDYDNRAAFLPPTHGGAADCAVCQSPRLGWRIHRYTRQVVCDICRARVPYVGIATLLDGLLGGLSYPQACAQLEPAWRHAIEQAYDEAEPWQQVAGREADQPTPIASWVRRFVTRTGSPAFGEPVRRERKQPVIPPEEIVAYAGVLASRQTVCGAEEYARLTKQAVFLLHLHARRLRQWNARRSGGLLFVRLPYRARHGHTARIYRALARGFRAPVRMPHLSHRLLAGAAIDTRLLAPRSRARASVQASAPSMAKQRAKRARKAASKAALAQRA